MVILAPNTTSEFTFNLLLHGLTTHINRQLTIYTEQQCSPGSFRECLVVEDVLYEEYDLSHIAAVCTCNGRCDFIYIKYNHILTNDQARPAICEAYFT